MTVSERLSDHAEVRRGYLILAISGHQSEASLRNYNGRPSSKQLRACSIILSDALHTALLSRAHLSRAISMFQFLIVMWKKLASFNSAGFH